MASPSHASEYPQYAARVLRNSLRVIQTVLAPVAARKTILLVEDDDSIRTLMATVLQDQGYHVLVSGDGIQAL